ncbi:hypothetical protein P12x_004526 [Tundrisphaera lichenicola]|uniref:hypothetical protein n=1 Tax=Tundrisphaera lichenicola TaxID=2029860 RepID=UPI003EBC5935
MTTVLTTGGVGRDLGRGLDRLEENRKNLLVFFAFGILACRVESNRKEIGSDERINLKKSGILVALPRFLVAPLSLPLESP